MASGGRKGLILMILACVLLVGLGGLAVVLNSPPVPKEFDRFRGIPWGASVGEVPGVKLLAEDGDLTFYVRDGDQLSFEDVEVNNIVYGFHKGHFYNVIIYYRTADAFSKIKERFYQQLGNAYHPVQSEKRYFWDGDKVGVLLTFDDPSDEGRVSFLFKPVANEVVAKEGRPLEGFNTPAVEPARCGP